MRPIIFLMGLSGVGKSTLGRYARDCAGWMWIEADPGSPPDPLRDDDPSWYRDPIDKAFLRKLKSVHRERCPQGILVTLPSTSIITPKAAEKLRLIDVSVVCLTAPAHFCRREFERREAESGSNLDASHWMSHNLRLSQLISSASSMTPLVQVSAVDVTGSRLPADQILLNMLETLEAKNASV